jgi:hypothetical protein
MPYPGFFHDILLVQSIHATNVLPEGSPIIFNSPLSILN